MAVILDIQPGRSFMGKLKHDGDLIEELTSICVEKQITLGRVEAIGAVKKARVGFYNQGTREYEFHQFDQPLEITALTGNISVKDGKTMVHAHVTLSDAKGGAFGGHLAPGTIVFACEYVIHEFTGQDLNRAFDEETGLPLWEL